MGAANEEKNKKIILRPLIKRARGCRIVRAAQDFVGAAQDFVGAERARGCKWQYIQNAN